MDGGLYPDAGSVVSHSNHIAGHPHIAATSGRDTAASCDVFDQVAHDDDLAVRSVARVFDPRCAVTNRISRDLQIVGSTPLT